MISFPVNDNKLSRAGFTPAQFDRELFGFRATARVALKIIKNVLKNCW